MRHTLVALALAAALPASPALATEARRVGPGGLEARLDAFVARGMRDWKVPGLSLVVVKDGAIVYQKGFGVKGAWARTERSTPTASSA